MSKAKKTRQEKVIADLRRRLQSTSPSLSPDKGHVQQVIPQKSFSYVHSSAASVTKNYSFQIIHPSLLHDLTKTTVITSTIVFTELLLYYLIQTKAITLPI